MLLVQLIDVSLCCCARSCALPRLAHQKKMEEALGYFQKALAMKARVHSGEERGQLHPDIAVYVEAWPFLQLMWLLV